MAKPSARSDRLSQRRRRRLELMAAFCKYWGMTPGEYARLTVEELDAMTKFANDDIKQRQREQRRRGR